MHSFSNTENEIFLQRLATGSSPNEVWEKVVAIQKQARQKKASRVKGSSTDAQEKAADGLVEEGVSVEDLLAEAEPLDGLPGLQRLLCFHRSLNLPLGQMSHSYSCGTSQQ